MHSFRLNSVELNMTGVVDVRSLVEVGTLNRMVGNHVPIGLYLSYKSLNVCGVLVIKNAVMNCTVATKDIAVSDKRCPFFSLASTVVTVLNLQKQLSHVDLVFEDRLHLANCSMKRQQNNS